MAERRYDERDVAEILREAAESQASRVESGRTGTGMTLPEIQRIASEVGIDSDQVAAAAARRLSRDDKPHVSGFWGGTTHLTRTRTSEGVLNDLAWEEVVEELRAAVGGPGTIGTVGSSREWTGGTGLVAAHLSAKPQDGTTRFRITLNQSAIVIYWMSAFIGIFLGSIAGGAIMSMSGVPPLATLATILAFVSLACLGANRATARSQRRNILLANSLLQRAEELVPERPAEAKDGIRANLANPPQVADEPGPRVPDR